MNLFLFFSACIGATFIVNMSYIFKPIRNKADSISPWLGKLLKCSQCMGFWIGLMLRVLFMWHGGELLRLEWSDVYNISYGFASSFICYSSYLLLNFFIKKYD